MGWYALDTEVAAEHHEPHSHPFDSHVYVVGGVLRFHDVATGAVHVCPPGTRVDDLGENVHREDHAGYRAIVGLRQDPTPLLGRT